MTSQEDLAAFVKAQRAIRSRAHRDLRAWWGTLPDYSPDYLKAALAEFLPLLVSTHGETSATIAADYYDLAREQSAGRGTRKRFQAIMASPVAEALISSMRYEALGPLFQETPDLAQTLKNLEGVVDVLSLQQGRDTIVLSSKADPGKPRWARVPVGKTCSWCIMLASRGAVYRDADSAGSATHYHDWCDCQPTPSWDDDADLPYDPAPHYERYSEARDAVLAEKSGTRAPTDAEIATKMRDLFGLK